MLDIQSITGLVEREIQTKVDEMVKKLTANESWIREIENKIITETQQRIVGRFQNAEQIPGLVQTVQKSIQELFDQGCVPGISDYVDPVLITQSLDRATQHLIQTSLDNLVVDPSWITKMQTMVDRNMCNRVSEHMSLVDVNAVIRTHMDESLERWRRELAQETHRPGISDTASQLELTVMDGAVVAESDLITKNLVVAHGGTIHGSLTVNDLSVIGTVNVDNPSWLGVVDRVSEATVNRLTDQWRQGLVQQVLDLARTQGIDFDSVTIGGEPLITGNRLNPAIKDTSIESLGDLRYLTTRGTTRLNNTMTVLPNRVGINTSEPEMALSVWDEEIYVIAGKVSRDRAFLGTGRRQTLAIGVDRKSALEIEPDNTVVIKNLRLDRWRITHGNEIPGYSGTRGDIVFNHDPKPDSAFAWICLGGFRWQPLKSA
jgi:hypothetical protein